MYRFLEKRREKMGDFNIGGQLAGQATGGILGLALAGFNDQRQRDQQEYLQNLQIRGNKEMMDYSMSKQYDMWLKTNYSAQKEQMKKAGLNPGLLYGMGGGGGQTTGSPGGSVSGGNAPVGGGEIGMGLQMGLQSALIKAQIDNINADTQNKQAENPNIPKIGKKIDAETASITQGINNAIALEKLTRVQTQIAEIQREFDSESKEDRKSLIYWSYRKALDETNSISIGNEISEATKQTKIDIITQEYQRMLIQNELLNANINLTNEQAKKTAADIQQGWKALDINQQNANTQEAQQKLNKWINDVSESTKLTVQTVKEIGLGLLNKLIPSKHIMSK